MIYHDLAILSGLLQTFLTKSKEILKNGKFNLQLALEIRRFAYRQIPLVFQKSPNLD